MALHGRFSAQPLEVVTMIEEPGQPAGDLEIPFDEERTMFKTISAALLAASVLAAPAFAATSGKTTEGKTTGGKTTMALVATGPQANTCTRPTCARAASR